LPPASYYLVGTGGQDSSKVGSVSFVEVRPVVECSDVTEPPMGVPGWKSKFCLGKEVILSLADIQRVYITVDSINSPPMYEVNAALDSNGAKGLTGFMRANVGKRMGIVVNGRLLAAPMIKSPPPVWRTILELKPYTQTEQDEAYQLVDAITKAMRR